MIDSLPFEKNSVLFSTAYLKAGTKQMLSKCAFPDEQLPASNTRFPAPNSTRSPQLGFLQYRNLRELYLINFLKFSP
jgi:hypothetical protein